MLAERDKPVEGLPTSGIVKVHLYFASEMLLSRLILYDTCSAVDQWVTKKIIMLAEIKEIIQ